ncbi:unnamed protein product [Lepidochelys olivacea]
MQFSSVSAALWSHNKLEDGKQLFVLLYSFFKRCLKDFLTGSCVSARRAPVLQSVSLRALKGTRVPILLQICTPVMSSGSKKRLLFYSPEDTFVEALCIAAAEENRANNRSESAWGGSLHHKWNIKEMLVTWLDEKNPLPMKRN